eukprot:6457926-Amphidinium_carterae.1
MAVNDFSVPERPRRPPKNSQEAAALKAQPAAHFAPAHPGHVAAARAARKLIESTGAVCQIHMGLTLPEYVLSKPNADPANPFDSVPLRLRWQ